MRVCITRMVLQYGCKSIRDLSTSNLGHVTPLLCCSERHTVHPLWPNICIPYVVHITFVLPNGCCLSGLAIDLPVLPQKARSARPVCFGQFKARYALLTGHEDACSAASKGGPAAMPASTGKAEGQHTLALLPVSIPDLCHSNSSWKRIWSDCCSDLFTNRSPA